MDKDSSIHLVYLILLGLMAASWFFSQKRQSLNKTMQQIVLWVFLFGGVVVLYGFRDQLRQQIMPRHAVETSAQKFSIARATDGHFYTTLTINGTDVGFVIDTGASGLVLSQQDARRLGFDPGALDYVFRANTANGVVRTARVKLDRVSLGSVQDANFTAWINDGQMDGSLLGMSYLSLFSHLEITGNTLYLTR